MISISEMLNDSQEQDRRCIENYLNNLRVAIPGYIVSFNKANQTATVQPSIKERLEGKQVPLPQLLDVPVCFPKAGGYSLTFPVKTGDECLIIFSDMCIDAWYQSAGIQGQLENRRHDLSDGIAILGLSSIPNAIKEFSNTSMQLRNENATTYMEISEDNINTKAVNINIKASNINIKGNINLTGDLSINGSVKVNGNMDITGTIRASDAILSGKSFLNHTNGGYSLD